MSRAGNILKVNLSNNEISTEPTSKYTRQYVGGGGIGAKLLWDNVPPGTKALDPENMLTFNAGPLTGTLLGTKLEVMSKSPKFTNSPLGTAGLGGQFPAEMKFAGYDHLAITGKADKPVYLYIQNDKVIVKDASHLWGLNTRDTQVKIKEELKDPDVQVACIGVAGENLVVYACIIHDVQNCASWGGFGAVMGSKNLKAIAIRGTKKLKIANPKAFMEKWDWHFNNLFYGPPSGMIKSINKHGSGEHYDDYIRDKVWQWGWGQDAVWEGPPLQKEDTLLEFAKKYQVSNLGCTFCPVQCQINYTVPDIGSGGATCNLGFSFRSHLKTYNTKTWYKACKKVNEYGIEGQEISMITGWLMLIYEKGLITAADTDGVPMEWGSEEAIMKVIDSISTQTGFGKHFRTGIIKASDDIAKGEGKQHVPYERNEILPYFLPELGVLPLGTGGMRLSSTRNHFLHY